MVSSSKKKRGKQRKAAKAQQAMAINSTPTVNNVESAGVFGRTNIEDQILQNLLIQTLQKKVQSGHEAGTLTLLTSFDSSTPGIICEAVVPDVLNFLNRCEDETFDQVMASVGGDLVIPATWIKLLFRADEFEPNCRLQIAKNIGPLVGCMCNDTERLFFKSEKHWRDGILPFAVLIGGMIDTSVGSSTDENGTDKKLVETLLNYDGLLSSIIQWGFWSEENRSDITTGLSAQDVHNIVSIGRQLTGTFITNAMSNIISENDIDLLKSIGTTPIISKEYDPNCMVSFVAGLIRELKNEGIQKPLNPVVASILQPLMEEADCIDKDVIMEMIDFGMNHVHDYESAVVVARLSSFMLCQELNAEECIESDTRIAFAIRQGLIEMCLNFVDRFRGHEAFGDKDELLYRHIESIFSKIYGISMHKKSWKAIDHKLIDVWDKLVCFEQNTDITNNSKCKKLLDMAIFILDINGRYCCYCNKSLSRTEVKGCNGCHNMVYCSRDCQKEDWLNGHNVTCCKSYTDVTAFGFFQGRVIPPTMPENERVATKLRELEKNITMIQLKLLLDHSETILNQAKVLDLPLYDCIVTFNLRNCPPRLGLDVKNYTDWFDTPELKKAFERTRSKENIMCVYFSSIFYGELDEDDEIPVLQMQKLYPHEWLTNKK